MNLHAVTLLVDGCHVDIGMELLVSQREDVGLTSLRLYAQVEVASIVPAADVHAGYFLPLLVFRESGTLVVAVDVVAHVGHQGIVHVAGIVPDAVLLRYPHVAHLNRQEILDDGLPHAAFVDVVGYAEHARLSLTVAHFVETRLGDVAEVGRAVTVAQEIAPDAWFDGADDVLAVGIDTEQFDAVFTM